MNWQEAKEKFTSNIRNDLAEDDQVIYFDDDSENRPKNYQGPGYYALNGGYWSLPLLDGQVISHYSEDVYQWTINRV